MEERESVLTVGLEETAPQRASSKKKKRPFRREWVWCYLAIGLPLFGFFFFNAFPIVISFAAMFCDANTYDFGSMQWNSFANFAEFFRDAKFLKSLGITFWLACSQFVSLLLAVVIASLLNARRVRGEKVFKTVKHLHIERQGIRGVFFHQPVVVMMEPDGIVAETRQAFRQRIAVRMGQKLRLVAEIDSDEPDPFFRSFFK